DLLAKGLLGFHSMWQSLFMARFTCIGARPFGRFSCLNRLTFIFTAPAAFTAFILANLFGMGAALLFTHGLSAGLFLVERQIAQFKVEPQIFNRVGKMIRQIRRDIKVVAIGMFDPQSPRMQVHFSAD